MFWAALLSTIAGLTLVLTFMAQAWTASSSLLNSEIASIQSYKPENKTNLELTELELA
jgi:hypothetical protein